MLVLVRDGGRESKYKCVLNCTDAFPGSISYDLVGRNKKTFERAPPTSRLIVSAKFYNSEDKRPCPACCWRQENFLARNYVNDPPESRATHIPLVA